MGVSVEVKDRRLFFLYAHPCGDVLVKEGRLKAEQLVEVRRSLLDGRDGGEPSLFRAALRKLEETAREMGKDRIDSEVIREYFLRKHNEDVDRECRVLIGCVESVMGDTALIRIGDETRKVNIEFVGKVKEGDVLSVHYDYACEKLGGL